MAAALLGNVAPTQALTVTTIQTEERDFMGDGCGSTSVNHLLVPAGAKLLRYRPSTATIEDGVGAPVARLTGRRARLNGKRAVRFTAIGSDDVCARPNEYVFGWIAPAELSLTYRTRERVYFRSYIMGSYTRARSRPGTVLFGNRTGIQRVRWSRWTGKVARGRGTLLYNDCNPNCAQARPQYFRVAIRLSRPRRCGGRYDYLRFAFRYTGRKPRGLPRTYAERHTCRPRGEIGPP